MVRQDPRDALTALATRDGVSLSALSEMLGRNPAYLQQYLRRGTPRLLAEADRRRLADFFGVDDALLGGRDGGAPDPPRYRLPRLDIAASAGPGALVDAEVTLGTETLDPMLARRLRLKPGTAAILRVRGDSMEPGLRDGDHIVVDTADRIPPVSGGVFVIRIDDAVMVKRVTSDRNGWHAISDNPAAPPVPPGSLTVIGRVVWQMRAWR